MISECVSGRRLNTHSVDGIWLLEWRIVYAVSLQFLQLFIFALFMFSMTNDMNYFLGGNTLTVTHSITTTNKKVYICKIIRIWFGFCFFFFFWFCLRRKGNHHFE